MTTNDFVGDCSVIENIIELAGWAPSGDNSQPWSFRVISPDSVSVSWKDTSDWCLYDRDGISTSTAIGMLLETFTIAARSYKLKTRVSGKFEQNTLTLSLSVGQTTPIQPDPLVDVIKTRSTNRFCYSPASILNTHKKFLEQSVGGLFTVVWHDSLYEKLKIARLNMAAMDLRLSMKSGFASHSRSIEWNAKTSTTKIPDRALGLNRFSLALMRSVMKSERRARTAFALGGKIFPKVEMELIPTLFSGSIVSIVSNLSEREYDDRHQQAAAAGAAIQRFWLTAAKNGISFQPQMSPLIFSRYIENLVPFTENVAQLRAAERINRRFKDLFSHPMAEKLFGHPSTDVMWVGRIGYRANPEARSLRKPQ